MVSNKMIYSLILRVTLIIINAIVFAFYVVNSMYLIIIINLLLLLIVQGYFLVRYILNKFRKINQYFDLIEFNDLVIPINDSGDKEVANFNQKIRKLNEHVSTIIAVNEEKTSFLEGMLNHIDIALVCVNNEGKFELINNAARNIFNMISPGLNERYFDKNDFFIDLKNIKVSENVIYNLGPEYENMKLLASSYNFKSDNEEKKIISLHNINNQLESQENESWLKLTRYLTHEIMNSVAPIVSTTKGINKLYLKQELKITEYNKNEIELINETLEGLEIIQERSEGLMSFISDYRDLFEIKKIIKAKINLEEFIKKITHVFDQTIKEQNISFIPKITSSNLVLEADKVLIEQVIINLIKNAIQAVKGKKNPIVKIYGYMNTNNKLQIDFIDNGIGIPEENFDKIFIPFYSTKKEGSGIGLSVSRFITQLHGAQLNVKTSTGKTIFSLVF